MPIEIDPLKTQVVQPGPKLPGSGPAKGPAMNTRVPPAAAPPPPAMAPRDPNSPEALLNAATRRINALEAALAEANARLDLLLSVLSITQNGSLRSVTLKGATVTLDATSDVVVKAARDFKAQASNKAEVRSNATAILGAPTLRLAAPACKADGVVSCQTLSATTVTAASYTPGAGNIW
jgi:hypothetical protein